MPSRRNRPNRWIIVLCVVWATGISLAYAWLAIDRQYVELSYLRGGDTGDPLDPLDIFINASYQASVACPGRLLNDRPACDRLVGSESLTFRVADLGRMESQLSAALVDRRWRQTVRTANTVKFERQLEPQAMPQFGWWPLFRTWRYELSPDVFTPSRALWEIPAADELDYAEDPDSEGDFGDEPSREQYEKLVAALPAADLDRVREYGANIWLALDQDSAISLTHDHLAVSTTTPGSRGEPEAGGLVRRVIPLSDVVDDHESQIQLELVAGPARSDWAVDLISQRGWGLIAVMLAAVATGALTSARTTLLRAGKIVTDRAAASIRRSDRHRVYREPHRYYHRDKACPRIPAMMIIVPATLAKAQFLNLEACVQCGSRKGARHRQNT